MSTQTMAAVATTVPHYINGSPVEGTSERFGNVYNPSTAEVTRRVPFATAAEVNRAVSAASAAFPAWAAQPPLRRARFLMRLLDALEREKDALAALITSEHGKVFSDAKGEVQR